MPPVSAVGESSSSAVPSEESQGATVSDKNTRWENDKEWAGWTIRDEVYAYVRKHWLPTVVSTIIAIAGSVWAFIRSHPTLGVSVGTMALTITAIVILALIDGRKRRTVPSSVKSNAVDGPKALVCGVYEGQRYFSLLRTKDRRRNFTAFSTLRVRSPHRARRTYSVVGNIPIRREPGSLKGRLVVSLWRD